MDNEKEMRDVEVRKLAIRVMRLCKHCVNKLTKNELLVIMAHRKLEETK